MRAASRRSRAHLLQLGVDGDGLGVELLGGLAEELALVRQLEDELAALAAGHAAERGRLPRERGHGGAHVGGQLGGGDVAVGVQVRLSLQALQQRPGEDGVATGTVVGHLLVGAAGGEHLAGAPARHLRKVLAQVSRRRRPAAREGQPAVAGVHHEEGMLGGDGLADVLEVGHRDGLALVVRRVRVDGDDVPEAPAVRQLAGDAVAREEDEHAVIALHLGRVRQHIAQVPRMRSRVASLSSSTWMFSGLKRNFSTSSSRTPLASFTA